MKSRHSRYQVFFDFGDAEKYREHIVIVRRSFEDIDSEIAEAAADRN